MLTAASLQIVKCWKAQEHLAATDWLAKLQYMFNEQTYCNHET